MFFFLAYLNILHNLFFYVYHCLSKRCFLMYDFIGGLTHSSATFETSHICIFYMQDITWSSLLNLEKQKVKIFGNSWSQTAASSLNFEKQRCTSTWCGQRKNAKVFSSCTYHYNVNKKTGLWGSIVHDCRCFNAVAVSQVINITDRRESNHGYSARSVASRRCATTVVRGKNESITHCENARKAARLWIMPIPPIIHLHRDEWLRLFFIEIHSGCKHWIQLHLLK